MVQEILIIIQATESRQEGSLTSAEAQAFSLPEPEP